MSNKSAKIRSDLVTIFQAGLDRVNPYSMISQCVSIEGDRLQVRTEDLSLTVDLSGFTRIVLIGAGKATAPMARAFEDLLGERLEGGIICVKEGHAEPLRRVTVRQASHPVPDERGIAAAREIMALASEAGEKCLVINCISGGGSALLPCPFADDATSLTLADKQQTTDVLLRCGASIQEINCVRKHISGIKGGRLLQQLAPARSLNFILSDVIGDDLSSIASGMTAADPTTYGDALAIFEKYGVVDNVPAQVVDLLRRGQAGELAESLKPGDAALACADNILIGTNRQALLAAGIRARELGYNVQILSSQIGGEAKNVARFIADVGREMVATDLFMKKPACLIVGGETVVTIRGTGKGGRNQEMALAFLQEMHSWTAGRENTGFLAASTDGNDGPTDAAGAFADALLLENMNIRQESIAEALANNDSYSFFQSVDGLLKTGPTNTNVCDIQILLVV